MKIGACIITYNPDFELLIKCIISLSNQVDKIIIVDNSSSEIDLLYKLCTKYSVQLISLKQNKGIAAATNIALNEFLKLKYDFVLTSDQDTNYPENYIQTFKNNYITLNDSNIAVFSPIFFDTNEKAFGKIVISTYFHTSHMINVKNEFTDVFHTIASGMIISLTHLKEIGGMNESLFIDWIDFEFCWRVHFYKKRIVCCKNMIITHHLGDKSTNIGFRKVSLRSYVRNYYITRNAFYLSTHTIYLNKLSKFIIFIKSFRYIIGYTILCDDHLKNLKYTLKGMHDGLHGNLGKLKE